MFAFWVGDQTSVGILGMDLGLFKAWDRILGLEKD